MLSADGNLSKQLMAQNFGPEAADPEHAIKMMDEAGIDMCCLVPHRQALHMNVDPRGPGQNIRP